MKTDTQNQGSGNQIPPKLDHVKIYFSQKNIPESEAEVFFFYYQDMDWKTETGTPVRDWKAAANEWVWNLEN